jgi:putative permease
VWGVFFAIPLATLVKAIINAWPTRSYGSELKVNEFDSTKADSARERVQES